MSIHDAYMDGDLFVARRWTLLDRDGYWLMDSNDLKTLEHRLMENGGGTIKPYDGKDCYRGSLSECDSVKEQIA